MNNLRKLLFLFGLTLTLSSCSSSQKAQSLDAPPAYYQLVERLTVNDELYSGWTNIFHYRATLLTEEVLNQQLDYFSKAYQWTEEEIKKERRKLNESVRNETKVFLSFYTPEIQYNDLNQSGSVWRVFLDVKGKRYVGRVTKVAQNYAKLSTIYPKHSPWSYPYEVSFPVPQTEVNGLESRLVVTGNLGVSEKTFLSPSTSSQ